MGTRRRTPTDSRKTEGHQEHGRTERAKDKNKDRVNRTEQEKQVHLKSNTDATEFVGFKRQLVEQTANGDLKRSFHLSITITTFALVMSTI